MRYDPIFPFGGAVLGLALISAMDRNTHNWEPSPAVRHFVEHPAVLTAAWFIYLAAVLRGWQKHLHDEPPADN